MTTMPTTFWPRNCIEKCRIRGLKELISTSNYLCRILPELMLRKKKS